MPVRSSRGGNRNGEVRDDCSKSWEEPEVEEAIRFVQYFNLLALVIDTRETEFTKNLDSRRFKSHGGIQMLQQPARRSDQDIHPPQSLPLLLQRFPTDHQPRAEAVILANLPQLGERLNGKLSGRGDDDGAEAIEGTPFEKVEPLEKRNEEGKSLPGTGRGGAENVTIEEGWRDGKGLDGCGSEEVRAFQPC